MVDQNVSNDRTVSPDAAMGAGFATPVEAARFLRLSKEIDTVPLPGDVTVEELDLIIGDMASLAFKWHKPLSARLLPVLGKGWGEMTEFDDPFLVNTKLQPLDSK